MIKSACWMIDCSMLSAGESSSLSSVNCFMLSACRAVNDLSEPERAVLPARAVGVEHHFHNRKKTSQPLEQYCGYVLSNP